MFHRLLKIKEWVDQTDTGATILPFSGGLELKLSEMEDDEREEWCKEHHAQRFVISQLNQLIENSPFNSSITLTVLALWPRSSSLATKRCS